MLQYGAHACRPSLASEIVFPINFNRSTRTGHDHTPQACFCQVTSIPPSRASRHRLFLVHRQSLGMQLRSVLRSGMQLPAFAASAAPVRGVLNFAGTFASGNAVPRYRCANGRRSAVAERAPNVAYARRRAAVRCAAAEFPVLQDHAIDVDGVVVKLLVEDLGGRRRRISGGIDVEASAERVWHVLTQYALMDRWMPNITRSVVQEREGETYLDQVGVISRRLSLKSRMLMRVSERPPSSISFSRVEGRDFSEFEGKYVLKPVNDNLTRLDYELLAIPMPLFPVGLVERKIVKEVPAMLSSARQEALFGKVVALT